MLVALPVFLVTLNVRVLFNAPVVYNTGFERNRIAENTGLPASEIERIGNEIREYLGNEQEHMTIFLHAQPLFTAREVEHMRDVKALLGLVYSVMYITGAAVLIYAAWGFRREGFRFLRRISMAGVVGGVGLIATGTSCGACSRVLTLFHRTQLQQRLLDTQPRGAVPRGAFALTVSGWRRRSGSPLTGRTHGRQLGA